jgi:hypothetical protein
LPPKDEKGELHATSVQFKNYSATWTFTFLGKTLREYLCSEAMSAKAFILLGSHPRYERQGDDSDDDASDERSSHSDDDSDERNSHSDDDSDEGSSQGPKYSDVDHDVLTAGYGTMWFRVGRHGSTPADWGTKSSTKRARDGDVEDLVGPIMERLRRYCNEKFPGVPQQELEIYIGATGCDLEVEVGRVDWMATAPLRRAVEHRQKMIRNGRVGSGTMVRTQPAYSKVPVNGLTPPSIPSFPPALSSRPTTRQVIALFDSTGAQIKIAWVSVLNENVNMSSLHGVASVVRLGQDMRQNLGKAGAFLDAKIDLHLVAMLTGSGHLRYKRPLVVSGHF